jgi:hypothetical protein
MGVVVSPAQVVTREQGGGNSSRGCGRGVAGVAAVAAVDTARWRDVGLAST